MVSLKVSQILSLYVKWLSFWLNTKSQILTVAHIYQLWRKLVHVFLNSIWAFLPMAYSTLATLAGKSQIPQYIRRAQ